MSEEASPLRVTWLTVGGEKRLATLSLAPGVRVYGERTVKMGREEYRLWDPFRSKLSGALQKGLKKIPIEEGDKVLYLGASTGTTASHVSDLIGPEGVLFAVEIAPRVAREFIENVAQHRSNIVPIIEDARRPDRYSSVFGEVDAVYCDIAQPDQTEIAIANCHRYLREGGCLLLAVKSRSIDVTKEPKRVFREEIEKLESAAFRVEQAVTLEPFDKDHAFIHAIQLRKHLLPRVELTHP